MFFFTLENKLPGRFIQIMQDVQVDLSGWCETKIQLMVSWCIMCLRSETPRTLVVAMVILGGLYIPPK